jgi:hypothetical protein
VAQTGEGAPACAEGIEIANDPVSIPFGRVCIAFDDDTLTWSPTWTRIDTVYPSLVTSYQIDRGRQYELDHTDTGRATVQIADKDGILDPSNTSGPFYNKIQPLKQISLGRFNPVESNWHQRFRGFIEEMDYAFDPSQKVNMLTMSCVDLFEILSAVQFVAGEFGDPPPGETGGDVYYAPWDIQSRMLQLLSDARIPTQYSTIFSGNVYLYGVTHSNGETVLSALQEAADAEWPGVANLFCDRFGRVCFHGRIAKFNPGGVLAGPPPIPNSEWNYQDWNVGDGAAILANGSFTQLRTFSFNRGLSKVINQALATPARPNQLTNAQMTAQTVSDSVSIGKFGVRAWSAQGLLTHHCLKDGTNDLGETKRFATYYVDNYANPQNRVTECSFRSLPPTDVRALRVWKLLSEIDISDSVNVTVASPGGGGFNAANVTSQFWVEGIHEQVQPLAQNWDDVTLSLDLSPRAYFNTNPFP